MKKLQIYFGLLFSTIGFAQVGHIMQGIGATNMSMGGAATAQPLSTSGAFYWNPATVSTFDEKILSVDAGIFFSSPKLSSEYMGLKGTTEDKKSPSIMPALSFVYGKENSKHTVGISMFGVSGFGVDFPAETNNPTSTTFNPAINSNPVLYPQNAGGFGNVASNYMMMQIGFTYAYNITEKFAIGINPIINYSALELEPNPLASPDMAKGYPKSNNASAMGYGAQLGLFYGGKEGFKTGISYKTEQNFKAFEFENTYLNGSKAPDVTFQMDYPAILSFGIGYSHKKFDFALDYRMIDYENTDGFTAKGWTQTASVKGFGWENISVLSAGVQLNLVEKLPIRLGYTNSGNPINSELAFFSIPATAIIENAYQIGLGYEFNKKITLNTVFHYGTSNGATRGTMLNPMMVSATNPYGAVSGSKVSYEMTTSMLQFGLNYKL